MSRDVCSRRAREASLAGGDARPLSVVQEAAREDDLFVHAKVSLVKIVGGSVEAALRERIAANRERALEKLRARRMSTESPSATTPSAPVGATGARINQSVAERFIICTKNYWLKRRCSQNSIY